MIHSAMLKNQNPVTMWVPQAARDTFKELAQATGKQQHEVVTEAAELLRKREARRGNQKLK